MQVSQQEAFITHAVIGNQETVTMGVSDDATLMHILSSTLYTYPMLASVREILCNGWDAHIAAGLTGLPLEITVLANEIRIRDFGTGIAHADIGPIYGVYGNSTKRDDSASTGGFGLGSKAPFAYTDNFEVTSCHAGVKTIYRVSKSSMELGGKPSINTIVQLPTDDSGITVSFGIQENDRAKFLTHIREVLTLGEIQATLNGEPVEQTLPLSQSPTGYLMGRAVDGTLLGRVNLRYGNVVYPVADHDDYRAEKDALIHALNRIDSNFNIVFQATPDSIAIAPSREALIFTPATVAEVKRLLQSFQFAEVEQGFQVAEQQYRQLMNQSLKGLSLGGLHSASAGNFALSRTERGEQLKDLDSFYFSPKQAAMTTALHCTSLNRSESHRKVCQEAGKRKELNSAFFAKYLKELNEKECQPHRTRDFIPFPLIYRYFQFPLDQLLKQDPLFEKVKYKVHVREGYYWQEFDSFREVARYNSQRIIFSEMQVIICNSRKQAKEYLQYYKNGPRFVVTLAVGNNKNTPTCVQRLSCALVKLGYSVRKHLPEREARERDTPRQTYKKKVGYPTLSSSYYAGDCTFKLRTAQWATESSRIEDPLAYVILNAGSSADHFYYLRAHVCRYINELFGDRVAVVTTNQATVLAAKGIPPVHKYFLKQLDQEVGNSNEFKRYLAFAAQMKDSYKDSRMLWYYAACHPTLMKSLGLRLDISHSLLRKLEVMAQVSSDWNSFPLCRKVFQQVKPHPAVKQLKERFSQLPQGEFINFSALSEVLRKSQPDSSEAQNAYSFIQHLLK